MSDSHNKRAKEILATVWYGTLATVSADGTPWVSPVSHVFDDTLAFYWVSDKESQHSRNVCANESVMFVVVTPETKQAVYIEATARELTDPAEILAMRRISKGPDYVGSPDEFLGDTVRRVYKAVPTRMWMNDAEITDGVFIRDYRVELSLS